MRTEVVMPQMGESVTEGTVTQWLKEPGDYVERDEPLLEITTDKVDAEVPSPEAGVLVERKVEAGQTVEINTVVAILDSEAEEGTALVAATDGKEKADESPSSASSPSDGGAQAQVATNGAAPAAASAGLESNGDSLFPSRAELRRTRSTPLVRRIAAEHGIDDLSTIDGSGLSGRVTKDDILAFIEAGAHQPSPAVNGQATGRSDQVARRGRDIKLPPVNPGQRDRVEPMGPQRQAIAEHMIASRATSAHAHTIHEIDFGQVQKVRQQLRGDYEKRGVKLTYTAFIVQAMADALQAFPVVNAAIDGDDLVYRGDVNIGVAVALEKSLIVPVIKGADELNLLGIARSIGDLAGRARNKKLSPDEVQGGTFTVSNHGIFGPEFGVPIINQPQTAIVSIGAIKKRVVVDQATDAIMVRPTAIFCMSFDHRSIDGATADRFLAHVRQTLENWS